MITLAPPSAASAESADAATADVTAAVLAGTVAADRPWVDTGVDVRAGQTLTLRAGGSVQVRRPARGEPAARCRVGPAGTFDFTGRETKQAFPLPAAGQGPAPCYALIGKVGADGQPFFVGRRMSLIARHSGRLWLAVNDFDHRDNCGEWDVRIEVGGQIEPLAVRRRVLKHAQPGVAEADCRVVIFYVDGLRPDVVEEMSAMGHLPHFTRTFLDGGTRIEHAFTAFPSSTITSNGSLWTGCFSDRHGIKAQVGFNRATGKSENYLGKTGPAYSGLLLQRTGLDKAMLDGTAETLGLFQGRDQARRFRQERTSDVPALYNYLAEHGGSYGAGVLPIMDGVSPPLWTRYMADEAPYLGTHSADRFVDEANAAYAVEHLLLRDDKVTIVWLPETDTVSHKEFRGQFGAARRTIVEVDRLLGDVIAHLRRMDRLQKTYLVVVSDHGHLGGRFAHLDRYDLANEFFHRPRRLSPQGRWIGGGLGMTVRQHRYVNRTQGDSPRQFAFVEAVGDGVARVFLPRGAYGSGDWSAPNQVGDLMRYQVSKELPPVDLPRVISRIDVADRPAGRRAPIDLVLAKIDDRSILITNRRRGWAVIDRRRLPRTGRWEYRYRVVTDVQPAADGTIRFREVHVPRGDPLLLAGSVPSGALGTYHDEQTWLHLTIGTPYPDGVVAMTRHLLWDERLRPRERLYAPDLVVCAGPGWQFNTYNEPGTAHGHPYHETMRISLLVAGPNVRRGATVSEPARAVDLLPTVLEMAGVPFDPAKIDGRPLRTIYLPARGEDHLESVPLAWQDLDLDAWRPLPFRPRGVYPHQPKTVNQPHSSWDLSNAVYNVMSVSELTINRLLDDGAAMLGSRTRPARTTFRRTQLQLEREAELAGSEPHRMLAEGGRALRLNKIGVGDYNWYSVGNLQRVDGLVDWIQRRATFFDRSLARPLGTPSVLGTPLMNEVIDFGQYSAWELHRVGTRTALDVLDRWVLGGVEDGIDQVLNTGRDEPPQIIVHLPALEPLPEHDPRPALPRLPGTPSESVLPAAGIR